ncbi:penicillin-binding protein 2 [Oceanobacillus arenosus]|uniref:serine-type D-Ala-D-Ala carboxypeptidase n=1 Tax=Oceanobacillus arenosus TaxID=1229153 RepID=A0A3D8PT85_9BACI|nr:penicillin-binding protein 2 [Oceanobacillus arenosus]RDW19204.1 penicillin-binding protein 2 [Oceanobacillus arenosus]
MVDKKKKKKKKQLPFRINLLFFAIFLLFSVLILQLGVVQILNGEAYQDEIDRTIQDTTKIPVPRGKIFDRNYNVVVDNEPVYSITYTPAKGIQAKERLDVAKKLAEYITMDSEEYIDKVTDRDKREYWYLENKTKADERLTEEAKAEMDNAEVYNATLDLITDAEIANYAKQELEVMAIKKELDKAYSLTPQIVKNKDVTAEEYAQVSEHLSTLPGINATTDWNRKYAYDGTISSILGSITSQKEGIPAEQEQYYLTRGYSRNDRVGKSGLEQYYEDILRGRKEQIEYTTTKDGVVVDSKTIVEGQRGKDLVLTIDMDFQEEVQKIVREELQTAISKFPYQNRFLEDALAVVMNPQNGEILAITGQHYNRKEQEFTNDDYRTLYNATEPGSAVKGATILAGYESGVITPGQRFYDRPIQIGSGGPWKGSWQNLGSVDDLDALRMSSNVYMFYIALRMGGDYRSPYPNGSNTSLDVQAFQQMRNYFWQFGLGVKTGIDFPYEATGYVGPDPRAGNLLDFAIGQYDTYTTMQLAQYVSTIANGGYRVQPHFLKEIREPIASQEEVGPVYQSKGTTVLNKIEMENIERVQEGFRRVFHSPGGTAVSYFSDKAYTSAGKTGTAETERYDENGKVNTENRTLVGYAPFEDPEIAVAIVVPGLGIVNTQHQINNIIGERIFDTYFEMKENGGNLNRDNNAEQSE